MIRFAVHHSLIGHFMALVTIHKSTLIESPALTLNSKAAGYRDLGQRCSGQIKPMAGPAAVFVVFIVAFVAAIVPPCIIDVVQAMGAVGCPRKAARFMTGRTFHNLARVSLKFDRSQIVIGSFNGVGPFGMRAAMTALTGDIAVTFAEAIQGVDIFRKPFVCGKYAGCGEVPCKIGLA